MTDQLLGHLLNAAVAFCTCTLIGLANLPEGALTQPALADSSKPAVAASGACIEDFGALGEGMFVLPYHECHAASVPVPPVSPHG